MVKQDFDAVVVLNRGLNKDGTLSDASEARVVKAVELYKTGRTSTLITSGAKSYSDEHTQKANTAEVMRARAIELGVPANAVILENSSVDTLGNLYCLKKLILEANNFRTIAIVSSLDHMGRVKFLSHKVFGEAYEITHIPSDHVLTRFFYGLQMTHEAESFLTLSDWLGNVTDGDDKAIFKLMNTKHPAYAVTNKS